MLIKKTGKNQTIFDLALQYYGNVEAIEEILNNNTHLLTDYSVMSANGLPFQSDVVYLSLPFIEGQKLYVDNESDYYKNKLASELGSTDIASFDNEGFIIPVNGIRDMTLEYDFIIL